MWVGGENEGALIERMKAYAKYSYGINCERYVWREC
jgi:hypothetical protein